MKIAVVDDTQVNLLIVRKHVELLGHTAVTARNGIEAIEVYERDKPDLILMDVTMPEMDGYEAARRIRALEGGANWTPIIFLTGLGAEDDLRCGIEAGGDDYLVKPVSPVVLGAKIKAMQRLHDMRTALVDTTHKLDVVNQELQRLSDLDGLTGIPNRRRFDETVQVEWRRNARAARALSLAMIDVDSFKEYNDHYGHLAGDECLRKIANALQGTLRRPGDLLARYGGEEFVAILPATPLSGGLMIGQQLREAVIALGLQHAKSAAEPQVTVSVGIATIVPDFAGTPAMLIAAADEMLYRAKHNGRNQVHGTRCGSCATITSIPREAA
jgi:diguanylate cyclase (GGDEF)-like protein